MSFLVRDIKLLGLAQPLVLMYWGTLGKCLVGLILRRGKGMGCEGCFLLRVCHRKIMRFATILGSFPSDLQVTYAT